MNTIDPTQPIAQIIDDHPELLDVFVDLGFTPLKQASMRNSVGRVMSLKNGAKIIGIPMERIKQELKWNGYTVKEEDNS